MCKREGKQPVPYEQRVSTVTAKLGGYSWMQSTPTCSRCHNTMHLILSMPSNGVVVVDKAPPAMVLQVFKCPLHAHEVRYCVCWFLRAMFV